MNSIAVKKDKLKVALKSFAQPVTIDLGNKTKKLVTIPLTDENKTLLQFLKDKIILSNLQKNRLHAYLADPLELQEKLVGNVNELFEVLNIINGQNDPVFEGDINGKYYPMVGYCQKFTTKNGPVIEFSISGQLGSLQYQNASYFTSMTFEDKSGKTIKKKVIDILKEKRIRFTTKEAVEKSKALVKQMIDINTDPGKVYDAYGPGLLYHDWFGWQTVPLGNKESFAPVIVEPKLEDRHGHYADIYQTDSWHLPFIRVFSLKHKSYVFVALEDVKNHVFHREDKSKIVLPAKMMTALNSIFNVDKNNIFGDVFSGRHGGIVVLANGPSGVGKTLTAEVFAEYQERPLYTMEMGEIGTNLKEVEANLQKIFNRAKKWNAVLLFDEADIFLSERVASDLERSAIVGIFLRLLDYYEGTFFLTTNRGEGIDKAFRSRVTLYLNYPSLSTEIRQQIWDNMVKASGLTVTVDKTSWKQIAEMELNGRQVRNQVRLLKLMYPNNELTTTDVMNSLEFTTR